MSRVPDLQMRIFRTCKRRLNVQNPGWPFLSTMAYGDSERRHETFVATVEGTQPTGETGPLAPHH